MSKYKRYERYKDSGIEWIGEIPEHWEMKKIKFIGAIYSGNAFKEELQGKSEGDYPFYKVSDINGDSKLVISSNNYVDKDDVASNRWNIVPENSILFPKIGEALKKNHRKINAYKCLIDNNIAAINTHEKVMNFNYFYYYFSCVNAEWFVNPGAVPSINNTYLKNFVALLPSKNEQKAVANFLDQKTAEIDALIVDKEKLIELLLEKQQAIITEAVTRGLNSTVRMKNSGIEWIGEIPEHWNNKKISWVFNIIGSGTTPGTSNLEYYDGDIPWVNTGDLNDGYLYETSKMITDLALKDYSTLKFYPIDTLLIAMYGATIGKLSITKIVTTTNQACCALAKPNKINIKFIFYWFLANRENIISLAYGGGQPNISQSLIKSLRVPLPVKKEQNEIVEYLDKITTEIDDLILDIKTQIQKLKEYRQSLISEAVTGKIHVREFGNMDEVICYE